MAVDSLEELGFPRVLPSLRTTLFCFIVFLAALYALLYGRLIENLPHRGNSNFRKLRREDIFDSCHLPVWPRSGFTADVIALSYVNWDPIKDCNRDYIPWTTLKDRRISRNEKAAIPEEVRCWARSVYPNGDYWTKGGSWRLLPEQGEDEHLHDADVIKVICWDKNDTTVHQWLHTQVVDKSRADSSKSPKEKEKKASKETKKMPSVYIILLDSVANTQAWRSLPKTIAFLEENFGAINFRHVNKVGDNSLPNGVSLFFGKSVVPVDRKMYGEPSVPPDWDRNKTCFSFHDKDGFVPSQFTEIGYKSLLAEDWAYGFLNWPKCSGFEKTPTTHYMRPFQIEYEYDLTTSLLHQGKDNCFEYHHFVFDYLSQFIEAYPDDPKIALVWASEIGHTYADGVFHTDGYFYDYLWKHRKEFNESFVFFLGDHGIRWGSVRKTPLGNQEINNPMLYISVPSWMRETQLVKNMRDNSEKLLTHFDTHATFIDILNTIRASDWEDFSGVLAETGLKGNSIFRPLPDGPRNCKTLPIPLEYCMCQLEMTPSSNKSLNKALAYHIVNHINDKIEAENLTDYCEELVLRKVVEVKFISNSSGLYEVSIETQPGKGQFKMLMRERAGSSSGKGGLDIVPAVADAVRLNAYGHAADCIHPLGKSAMRPFCVCRNQSVPYVSDYAW